MLKNLKFLREINFSNKFLKSNLNFKFNFKFFSTHNPSTPPRSTPPNTPKTESTKIYLDLDNSKLTQIYEYKNATDKLRYLYWGHILYIYGNSILLSFEIFDPAMGYFHGLMLSLSLSLGWGSLMIIGNIMKRTVHKIYRVENLSDPSSKKNKLYKIEYLSFIKKGKSEVVDRYDLVDYSMSNLENFHFMRIRSNKYKKIYVNTHKNIFEANETLHREFKDVVSGGLE
jgi:hypothetical protein